MDDSFYLIFNADWEAVPFVLPKVAGAGRFALELDTGAARASGRRGDTPRRREPRGPGTDASGVPSPRVGGVGDTRRRVASSLGASPRRCRRPEAIRSRPSKSTRSRLGPGPRSSFRAVSARGPGSCLDHDVSPRREALPGGEPHAGTVVAPNPPGRREASTGWPRRDGRRPHPVFGRRARRSPREGADGRRTRGPRGRHRRSGRESSSSRVGHRRPRPGRGRPIRAPGGRAGGVPHRPDRRREPRAHARQRGCGPPTGRVRLSLPPAVAGRAAQAVRRELPTTPAATRRALVSPLVLWTRARVMRPVLEALQAVAGSRATVLLFGDSGVGKEVMARAVHADRAPAATGRSSRSLAGLPRDLLESELFGHEKGAFTGATGPGEARSPRLTGARCSWTRSGPPPAVQAKLLRVLQERRVGPSEARGRAHRLRVIGATSRDYARRQEITFREDLYFRLAVVPIRIPTLRERPEDIALLAEHFRAPPRAPARPRPGFDPHALAGSGSTAGPATSASWSNLVERAVTLRKAHASAARTSCRRWRSAPAHTICRFARRWRKWRTPTSPAS